MREEELARLSSLAKLTVTKEESAALSEDLRELLCHLNTLSELPEHTADTWLDHTASVTREDVPAPCLAREDALRNAPLRKDGFFVIP